MGVLQGRLNRGGNLALICVSFLFVFLFSAGKAVSETNTDTDFPLAASLQDLFTQHQGKSGGYVLEKGEESLLARAWLTDHAAKSIHVQYFIWSLDNIGILAAEALLRAAQKGTQVRVLVDDLLMDAPDETMLALNAHPNVQIRIYNPKNSVGTSQSKRIANLALDFRSFNQRMHDKTFIVDGSVAITGGRNMADEYFDYDQEYNFRDRDILLLGSAVRRMEASFDNFWISPLAVPVESLLESKASRLDPEKIERIYGELHSYAANPANFAPEVHKALENMEDKFPGLVDSLVWDEFTFICDKPGKNEEKGLNGGGESTNALVEALGKARKRVVIQTPYLVMPDGGLEFFKGLIARGVTVAINTNSMASTDNLQAFSGYSKQRKKILKAGIEVFEFRPDPAIQKVLIDRYEALKKSAPIFAIHAKSMVIDSETAFIGTFNFDPRSANLNTEVGVLVKNRQIAEQVEKSIKTDMLPENSWNAATDNPDSHSSLWKRAKISFWKIMPITSLL